MAGPLLRSADVERSPRRSRWLRFAAGLVVLAAAIALLTSDAVASLSAAAIRSQLLALGAWGPVLFVLAFALLQPLGIAAHVFIVAASLVWGPVPGLLLSWVGALAASSTSFWFARWMGHEWVQARLPAKLQRWDARLATHGFRTVLVMRLLLFTFGPMQLMLGVSQVRFASYLAASALGLLPMIALDSFVGAGVVSWFFE